MDDFLGIKKSPATRMTVVCALGIVLSVGNAAWLREGWSAPGRHAPAAPSRQGPTDAAELEAFLDEWLGGVMEERHIAGSAVAVVKDGALLFTKGYGFADLENRVPVDPERTLFRTGSVGKLFTWTAVMQLVEQGKLDPDADINAYLDFRIPDTYPQPITLKHLMTHTSGFEDVLLGSVVADTDDLVPVRDWLVAHRPSRVCPPGDCAGYANYNAMLAGYIVARVSGLPYDEYIQEHIFGPLGMLHSTARSPIPSEMRGDTSLGYTYEDGAFRLFPEFKAQPALLPSGGHYASVTDMARFMIAHLGGGRYSDRTLGEARILEEATARRMQGTLHTPDPRLLGTAYGIFDVSDNGQRTLGHQGYAPPMHSQLLLLPDQGLGVYVVFNSAGADGLTTQHTGFQRAFFDHYFSAPAAEPVHPPANFAERAGKFAGLYRNASAPHSTLIKIIALFGGYTVAVSDPGDGTLLLDLMGSRWRFAEVEPLFFRQVDGPFLIVFREDESGRITRMDTDLMPQYTNVKLRWYETPGFNFGLLLACVLAFVSMIAAAAIHAIRNRRPGDGGAPAPRGAGAARRIIVGICVLNLLFLVGAVLWGRPETELGSISWMAEIVLGLGVVSALLTVGALFFTALAWKNGYWGLAARAHYTLATVAAAAFVWFLNYWNLLGWRY